MLIKVENKIKLLMKLIGIIFIFIVIVFQFNKIFLDFNTDIFYTYKDKLSCIRLFIIAGLGLLSYLPLSLYDFIIKDTCKISLDKKSLYKSSWIASSISSIIGFGGTASIALKSYFYSPYIKDKANLVKEISKVVLLNFTGFSMLCLIYSILNIKSLHKIELVSLGVIVASLYAPIIFIYNIFRFIKNKKRDNAIKTIKTMILSSFEWSAMALLLFFIFKILGSSLTLYNMFPIYVVSSAVGLISMMPGGIGGFDITFILGVGSLGIGKEEALLALVLYRISYYIVPLIVGLFIFLYELRKRIKKNCIINRFLFIKKFITKFKKLFYKTSFINSKDI